ncbi:hypothetical protein BDW59DRAFT_164427 [Aspergillus cavernicola]|uniref:Six-hairpin glycosidase-like protein n=1 Tax=Aspergillus cavernicola TaxID=176166 RepID=A0ABR4I0P0_9EURO
MKFLSVDFVLTFLVASGYHATASNHSFNAERVVVGTSPSIPGPSSPYREFTLTLLSPIATLDYGADVAGVPTFEVDGLSGPAQIEVKYSEQFTGLLEPFSDGPSLFVSSLANSFQLGTFNITGLGRFSSDFIQGRQRWQIIRLLTNSTVRFRSVSFNSSVGAVQTKNLPGTFQSSNPLYNQIWELGARAASLACFDAGSQESTWKVDRAGTLVSSSIPSYSGSTYNFTDYDLEFDAKIVRGGFIWSMGYNFGIRSKGGILLNLPGNYPVEFTFLNTNKTLFPPSTITLAYGVNFEGVWYRISTIVRSGYLAVSLNQTQLFNVSLSDYYEGGSSISSSGAFGFGAWQDQSTYIRNVTARDSNTTLIYQNSMTNTTTPASIAPKRDRLVWLGDFVHTKRIIDSAVDWLALYHSNSTGLLDFSLFGTAFLGPTAGSAINTASVEAFQGMASVAAAVGDTQSYNKPRELLDRRPRLRHTSGSANNTQARRALSHLPSLKLGPGYRDSTKVLSFDPSANLSPNTNGFLPVLLQQKQAAPAGFLLENLWVAMLASQSSNSGASWEYVNQQSGPGLGQFTSVRHPWGGAATYALTNYIAGIRPLSFGYGTWVVDPAYVGFALDHVTGFLLRTVI